MILLPSSSQTIAPKNRNQWLQLAQPQPFIEGFITGDLNDKMSAESMNAMVSGIPSPWARAKLFNSSFQYANAAGSGLSRYCKLIVQEWKGLIALMALYPGRFTFKQVHLNPNQAQTSLSLTDAMGSMLFQEADLWTNLTNNPDGLPSVQLIYYNNDLIGFMSPYTLVCTAAEYSLSGVSWFRDGKLNDPMTQVTDRASLQKLHLLVNNIRTNLHTFEANINQNRPANASKLNFLALRQTLTAWSTEIAGKLGIGASVTLQGTLDSRLNVVKPYYDLFNIHQYIWYIFSTGIFSRTLVAGAAQFDVRELLSDTPCIAAFDDADTAQPLKNAAVHYLAVGNRSFAVPLSHLGFKIFKDTLSDVLAPPPAGSPPRHHLSAQISPTGKLAVSISLAIGNIQLAPIQKEYEILQQSGTTPNCILWPNFYSEHWNRYYLYSELPRNTTGFKIYPFYREGATGDLCTQADQLIFDPQAIEGAIIKNLINYPAGVVDTNHPKYELIVSNKPIAGIEIRTDFNGSEVVCGLLPLKNGAGQSVRNLTSTHAPQAATTIEVGIDFGSNNTSISYSNLGQISPIVFTNRRVFLLGTEVIDTKQAFFAKAHELMFFQNETPKSGQFKSWIHKPDERYRSTLNLGDEFVAGNPVFEPNIEVHLMSEFNIKTHSNINIAHNLKWKNDATGLTSKQGFMKTLFLKICAELYADENARPDNILINWAYPSALSNADRTNYRNMYLAMISHKPIQGVNATVAAAKTESHAVCNYAIGPGGLGIHGDTMMIGIDVGGSTSDILLVANLQNPTTYEEQFTLLQQSSVRLSAGKLASVIEKSNSFAATVLNYVNSKSIAIAGVERIAQAIPDRNAPYYLNAMFDRLTDTQFDDFYRDIFHNARVNDRSKAIFAIPTYITGALMYYSGQLIRYALDNRPELAHINQFQLYPFGKGGRLFDWLTARFASDDANAYYEKCLKAGIGRAISGFSFQFLDVTRTNIKSEVSMGLLSVSHVVPAANNQADLVGEEGFSFSRQPTQATTVINSTHFQNFAAITAPTDFVRFKDFLNIYLDFVHVNNGNILHGTDKIKQQIPNLRNLLMTYIPRDPQYIIAKGHGANFSYSQPMFILTAMSFLDNVIIPLVQQETV